MLKQFSAGSCYSYILSSNGEALVIDPHISLVDEYLLYLKKNRLALKYIVDTHTHADHFSSAAVLKKATGAGVLMHEKAVSNVAGQRLKEGERIKVGSLELDVMYTPGHTDDSVSLKSGRQLFTGDVLLIGSVGRTDFQNGSPESMFETIRMFKSLPKETQVYPGHDYHGLRSTSIGREKARNPFFKYSVKEEFSAFMRSKTIPKPFNIDNIVRANQKGDAAALRMVSVKDAASMVRNEPQTRLLDVRSAFEFNQEHIQGALNVPIDSLQSKIAELAQSKQDFIVLCRTGNRSPMAADMLLQSGISGVRVMQGGMTAWKKERLPVVKGEAGMSLERQVRLIAGTLVVSGIILSWFINPLFIYLPLFVGCGLIFAGLTDNCLMGMLLLKLPYNRKLYGYKPGGGTCAMG